jgi:hypothetical protein
MDCVKTFGDAVLLTQKHASPRGRNYFHWQTCCRDFLSGAETHQKLHDLKTHHIFQPS